MQQSVETIAILCHIGNTSERRTFFQKEEKKTGGEEVTLLATKCIINSKSQKRVDRVAQCTEY